jgi:N-acetylglucosaminyl-diphospho-decaprenol L-rhamnosyltransferase
MSRVAIVVVTYNSASVIGPCLDALQDGTVQNLDAEIVVVDNASDDETRDRVAARGIRLIANMTNGGFAAAVNQGVRATTAPLVLLLNPDAVLVRGLDVLEAEFLNPETGAAGGLLTDAAGCPQAGFMVRSLPGPTALVFEVLGINSLFPSNKVNWHYRCLGYSPVTPAFVEQPAGAFLMFRRTVWERLGGFDERFFPVWFEDVDFCVRIKEAGFRIRYNPVAVAKHTGAHSVGTLPLAIRERYWYGSLLKYAAKHYPPIAFGSVCGAVALGAVLRAVRVYPRYGFKAVAVYGAVCRLALGHLWRGRGAV